MDFHKGVQILIKYTLKPLITNALEKEKGSNF